MEFGSNMNEEEFEWDDEFDEIVSNLGNLVGINEVNGRKYFGDSQYEKLSQMAEIASQVAVERDFAALNSTRAKTKLTRTFSTAIFMGLGLAFMWSVYFWVTNV